MRLVTALSLVLLAVAAGMVAFSLETYPPDDPYRTWGIALLAVPPGAIGLLILAPWRSVRTSAGWLALLPGAWWVVAGGADLLSGMLALVSVTEHDPVGTIVKGAAEGLLAALHLAVFWAVALRDRGTRGA